MKTLILFLLFTIGLNAQEGMVLIKAEQTIKIVNFHTMTVPDDLTKKVVQRYVHYMESNPINYENGIRRVKKIVMIKKDRYFVSDFKNGTLYLNDRLNEFPSTKEVVILQELARINGMALRKATKPHVTSKWFNINDKNEEIFRRQLTRHSPYKYVVLELEELSPLRRR